MITRPKNLTIATIAVVFLLLAFVAFLLVSNYVSQTSLKETLRTQFVLQNDQQATNLTAFINNRRSELAVLAASRVIDVFFANRALGMSMDYGLRQSLPPIKQKFSEVVERNLIGIEGPYRRIALIDDDGTLLVDVRAAGVSALTPETAQSLNEPRYRTCTVLPADEGRTLLLSLAYYFKDRYAGQIVAWIPTQFLYDYVLTAHSTPSSFAYLVSGKDVVLGASAPGGGALPFIEETGSPVEFDGLWRERRPARLIAVKNLVMQSPFALVTVAPVRDVYGRLEPGGLLVGMAVFAVIMIGSAVAIFRMNTRSLVLSARLGESIRHDEEVTRKNVQLELEIYDRKRAESALRESQERYRMLIETSPDIIYTVSADDCTIRSLNSAFERVTGWPRDPWIGMPFVDFIHPDDRQLALKTFDEALQGKPRKRYELRCLTASGEYRTAEFTSSALAERERVVAALGIARDITDRKRLEEQLRHAVKMEAVGQLAGGIAHDFNNMLSVIIGYGNFLQEDMRPDDPLRPSVDLIMMSAERAAHLTQNLLTFSRKQVLTTQPVDLVAVIRKVEPLLSRLIGEDIQVRLDLPQRQTTVLADAMQMEQVLMNLATNARDAMPRGGSLTVGAGIVEIDDAFRAARGFGKPGTYAAVTVADTGGGMDESVRQRIFEPFFTTKKIGKGTGLGLSIVFGIVKQHHGYIDVATEKGRGTTFTLFFPLLSDAVEAPSAEQAGVKPRGGSETILLAEDSDDVRAMLTRVLRDAGYRVIETKNGAEAVATFGSDGGDVRLLLLDVIMPGLNGKEALDAIKKIRPGIRALFISGYTADILDRSGLPADAVDFLPKPVLPSVLLKRVREILDR